MPPKLILFDLDGTLAPQKEVALLPGVHEWFNNNIGQPAAICTNQGGVGMRYWMQTESFGKPEEYPTEQEVCERLEGVLRLLPPLYLPNAMRAAYVCFAYQSKQSGKWSPTPEGRENDWRWDRRYRKPAPGMLKLAMEEAETLPRYTMYVGDSVDDQQAAAAASVEFVWAHEFFGRGKP